MLLDIQNANTESLDFDALAEGHYLRLQQWLLTHEPEAKTRYPSSMPFVENPVVCAEYSVATQVAALRIDINTLQEPILDTGCGKEHQLVTFLAQKGLDVYGMDREATPTNRIHKCSWLDYAFEADHWGTIISHLGFSNHFRHQHLKENSLHRQYASTYVRIIRSLKTDGCFYYTPDLPFIEAFLDSRSYSIQKTQVPGTAFYSTCITRLVY